MTSNETSSRQHPWYSSFFWGVAAWLAFLADDFQQSLALDDARFQDLPSSRRMHVEAIGWEDD